jgi:hypothetical protein
MVEVGGLDGLTLGPVLPRAKENFHTTPALSVVFFAWMGGLFGGVLGTFSVVNGWWWYFGDAAGGILVLAFARRQLLPDTCCFFWLEGEVRALLVT